MTFKLPSAVEASVSGGEAWRGCVLPKMDRSTVCFKAEASVTGTGKRDNMRLLHRAGLGHWGPAVTFGLCLIYKSNGSN